MTTTAYDIEASKDTLGRFLRDEVIPLEKEAGLSPDVAPPAELRRKVRRRAHALGFYAADMPREAGGGGLALSERVLLDMEALSHETVFFEDVMGGPGGPSSILLACDERQREKYLLPLVRGEITTCFALSEPEAGSDAGGLRLRARRTNGTYVLNGTKNIITNAPQCDFAMVFAVTDEARGAMGGITCFLVDKGTPGFSVGRVHTCMGFTGFQGELVFEECEVPAASILGQEGYGLALALDWINANRIKIGAAAAGLSRRLLAASTAYAARRRQFGRPIGDNQGIQWKLADMATELFAVESMVTRVAAMWDRKLDVRKEAAMVKLYASEMVNRAAYEAIQIHGGTGCLLETGLERVARMVRVYTIVEGTSEIQRIGIARRLLKELAA
ncbi:MAG: acyl-CoA dehydrogenase family protein [Deltaproteobacteria bacterium]|nr:acyl-CoA dehydrogenase family protein [Deltaproteobacteria bacterium]